jgi:hypothetical protein
MLQSSVEAQNLTGLRNHNNKRILILSMLEAQNNLRK